jgi:hypothetical protein
MPHFLFAEWLWLAEVIFVKSISEGLKHAFIAMVLFLVLDERRIRMIQFEYGQLNKPAGLVFSWATFMNCSAGAATGSAKIYPAYVDFKEYHFTDDWLWGANFDGECV